MTTRRATITGRAAGLIAACLMAAGAGGAPAQEVEPEADAAPQAGPMTAQGDQHPPVDETANGTAEAATTPAQRLDALFASLVEAEPQDARRLERRILGMLSDSGSDSMDFLLSRGRAAMEAEEHEKAVEHLSALVDLAPDFAEGWNARATAHYVAKDFWASMVDIQRVLALEPRHFGALAGLASILEQTGDEAGALRVSREALKVNPHMDSAREAVERLGRKVDGSDI